MIESQSEFNAILERARGGKISHDDDGERIYRCVKGYREMILRIWLAGTYSGVSGRRVPIDDEDNLDEAEEALRQIGWIDDMGQAVPVQDRP